MLNNSNPIFLVDDDTFHLEIMKQLLDDEGIQNVKTYESGIQCLNALYLNPDIIFLDHQMDEYTGYETLRKIKRHNPNIFVVIVSAQEDIDTAVSTLKHGAFDYIKKDSNLDKNIKAALIKIREVKTMLRRNKPSLFQRIISAF